MVVLRVNDTGFYVKGIDDKTDKLIFTENSQEAEDWFDDWRAGTRIQFLKTHVSLGNIHVEKEQEGFLDKLIPYYVDKY